MPIRNNELMFRFKMKGDTDWQTFQLPLAHLKKNDLTDEETLSEEIKEVMYAMDDRTYKEPDDVVYDVKSYWGDIVIPCHERIYTGEGHRFEEPW